MSGRVNFWIVFLVVLLCGCIGWVFFPVGIDGRESASQMQCFSQLKQLGTAIEMYLGEFNGQYPARAWHTPLLPYLKSADHSVDLFSCPVVRENPAVPRLVGGYAMNAQLRGAPASTVANPVRTALLFEVDTYRYDVFADIQARSLTRHTGVRSGSNVLRVDGSGMFMARAPK